MTLQYDGVKKLPKKSYQTKKWTDYVSPCNHVKMVSKWILRFLSEIN